MDAVVNILRFITLVGSGIAAGTLWTTLAVIVPIARQFPPGTTLEIRRNIDPRVDRYNPPLVILSALAALIILILRHNLTATSALFTIIGLLAMIGVIVVSLGFVARVTHQFEGWSPDSVPTEFSVLATRWDTLHTLRAALGVAAFISFAIAALAR